MLINTSNVAAALGGTVFPGARTPWTSLSVLGAGHVLMQTQIPAAGLPAAIDIRKQYVHKTRESAGGDGAMGPYPEREPA